MAKSEQSLAEVADQRSRRRNRGIWVSALFFLMWQGAFYQWSLGEAPPTRLVDQIKLGGWFAWTVVLLVLLATGGAFLAKRDVRRLMNDEVSSANRASGQRWGFWAAVLTVFAIYFGSFFVEIGLHDALHLVLTFALGAGLLRWAVLERRSDRLG